MKTQGKKLLRKSRCNRRYGVKLKTGDCVFIEIFWLHIGRSMFIGYLFPLEKGLLSKMFFNTSSAPFLLIMNEQPILGAFFLQLYSHMYHVHA